VLCTNSEMDHLLSARGHCSCHGWLAAILILALTGCGSDLASVSGTVTLDSQPLAGSESARITVMFYPETGVGVPAAGITDERGAYDLATGSQSGIAPGAYLVAISGAESIPPKKEFDMPGRRQITPVRYADPQQSGFRVEVKPGGNEFDFNLRSSGPE